MSPKDMISARPSRSSDCRASSSGSKRKRGAQKVETVDIVIRNAMECANDQLRAIADWSKLAREDEAAIQQKVMSEL